MTLHSTAEIKEKVIKDSKLRVAHLADTQEREAKPLLLSALFLDVAFLIIHFMQPSIFGAIGISFLSLVVFIFSLWILKLSYEISVETKFQKRVQAGNKVTIIEQQDGYIVPGDLDPQTHQAITGACTFLGKKHPIKSVKIDD